MRVAPIPSDETQRLSCLQSLEVLDTPPDVALDAITHAVAMQLGVPIALVSLVDSQRQWFKSRLGLAAPETSRDIAFCSHAILGDGPFVVADTLADSRFADNPLVTGEPHIRFYAGEPLRVDGQPIGTLCVIDRKPRVLSPGESESLRHLARATEACLVRERQFRRVALSEARLRDFAGASSDFLWECDTQLRLTWVSPHAEAMSHEGVALSIGDTLWNGPLLDTMGQPQARARTLAETMVIGRPFMGSTIEVEGTKGLRIWSLSGVPVHGTGATHLGWRGSARDVTSAVATQRKLRDSDERLQRIAHHVQGMLFQCERQPDGLTQFRYVSEGVAQICELPGAEALRDAGAVLDRVHPDDRSHVAQGIDESARLVEPWRGEFRMVLPKRGVRWVEGHATPQIGATGGVVWHGFITDITERKGNAEALEVAHQRQQMAIEAAQMGVLLVDPIAGTIELDRRSLGIHALSPRDTEQLLWSWLACVAPEDHEVIHTALSETMVGDTAVRATYSLAGEDARRIEIIIARQQSDGLLMGLCRDITDTERAEQALREAGVAQERRRKELEFLARVSHELRTPMNAILGFAQLLSLDTTAPLAAHQRRWLDQVRRGGQHLLGLVEDVLSLARVGATNRGYRLAPQSVAQALANCAELLSPLAQTAQVRIELDRPTRDAVVLADRLALRQVLVNIIGNAIKYNRRHGAVTLTATIHDDACVLEIVDDGPGIPVERRDAMFEPFARLGAEIGSVPGSGLGLSVAKELVEAMDGRLEARFPSRGGTCIQITLPLADPALEIDPDTVPGALDERPAAFVVPQPH